MTEIFMLLSVRGRGPGPLFSNRIGRRPKTRMPVAVCRHGVVGGEAVTDRQKFGVLGLLYGGHVVAQLFDHQLHQFFHGQVVRDMLNI